MEIKLWNLGQLVRKYCQSYFSVKRREKMLRNRLCGYQLLGCYREAI